MSNNKQKKNRKQKSKNTSNATLHSDESTSRFWAHFWRDGYWFFVGILLVLIDNEDIYFIGFSISAIIYGVYWLYIAKKVPRHFVLAMVRYDRENMKNARKKYNPERIHEWQHRANVSSLMCIIGGIIFLIISIIILYKK